jgi:hypothetical protein
MAHSVSFNAGDDVIQKPMPAGAVIVPAREDSTGTEKLMKDRVGVTTPPLLAAAESVIVAPAVTTVIIADFPDADIAARG